MMDLEKVPVEDLINFLYWVDGYVECSGCDFVIECSQEKDGTMCIEFLYKKYKEYEAIIEDMLEDSYDDDWNYYDWDDDEDFIEFINPFWDDLDEEMEWDLDE